MGELCFSSVNVIFKYTVVQSLALNVYVWLSAGERAEELKTNKRLF